MVTAYTPSLIDRDESTLMFNQRVLDMARRPEIPLLERLRYLCIVSSNLDEFFEVRVALQLHQIERQGAASTAVQTYQNISEVARSLVYKQYQIFNDELMPALLDQGIQLITFQERNKAQHKWVKQYFEQHVKPLLIPVSLDPSHPFPQVANKSLNFIVRLSGKDAFGRENEIAIVKVPRSLPRVMRLPGASGDKNLTLVTLSSVIRSHLEDLFPDREVGQFSQFRLTRDSELSVDEEEEIGRAHV